MSSSTTSQWKLLNPHPLAATSRYRVICLSNWLDTALICLTRVWLEAGGKGAAVQAHCRLLVEAAKFASAGCHFASWIPEILKQSPSHALIQRTWYVRKVARTFAGWRPHVPVLSAGEHERCNCNAVTATHRRSLRAGKKHSRDTRLWVAAALRLARVM